jgi:hypothetical protein
MSKIVLVFTLLVLSLGSAFAGPDEDGIRAVMKGTWDKPDAKVDVSPITIAGDHAIAGWTQGEMGGRALLRRQHGHWIVVLCAGDDLLKPGALKLAGIAAGPASELLSRNAAAEQGIPAARRAQFSKFEGLVTMDASGAHPPQDGHGAHGTSGHQSHK